MLANRSVGSPILLKIVSENPFSGKTYFIQLPPEQQPSSGPLEVLQTLRAITGPGKAAGFLGVAAAPEDGG